MTQQMTRPNPRAPLVRRRWTPLLELEELQASMDQLMQAAFGDLGAGAPGGWTPSVDIEETEDAWILEAEVPGVNRDDLNVELRDSEIMIRGEVKERERKGTLRRRTRRVGEFEYRATLPGDADPDGVEASLKDGVLTLRIPKAEQARPRRIEVSAS